MKTRVVNYAISWANAQRKGYITLMTLDSQGKPTGRVPLTTETSADFFGMLDVLRSEKPLFWNDSSSTLESEFEPVGEAEK